MQNSNQNKIVKLKILRKIEADRAQKEADDQRLIDEHLPNFLELKKNKPKNKDERHYQSGELKTCYYGNTHRAYTGFFKRFLAKYKYFNVRTVQQWRQSIVDSKKKKSTYNHELTFLKGFSDYLFNTGVLNFKIVNTKVYKYKRTTDQVNYEILSPEDTKFLLESTFDDKVVAYVQFCLLSGLRASELIGVTTFRFDKSKNYLYIKGKGGLRRILYLNKRLQALRLEMIANPLKTTSNMNKRLKRFLKLRNMSAAISFHCFRATFATKLYDNGEKLERISRLLGHQSLNTTTRYIEKLRKNSPVQSVNPFKEVSND